MQQLRALWLRLHRWTALALGWIPIVSGMTGAALVAVRPLDRLLHPGLFQATAAPLEAVRQALDREFGARASYTFRPPREAGNTLWVLVRGAWSGTLYLDPATGRELGRRGETEGLAYALFKLHSALLLRDTGKAVLACAAAAYLALLATGLALWWPRRWPPSWRIAWRNGLPRILFDVHRVGGAALGVLVAVSVASGAYMAWRPLAGWVTAASGARPVAPPVTAPSAGPAQALDVLVARARAIHPAGTVGYVQVPAQTGRPVRVRLKLPDDPPTPTA